MGFLDTPGQHDTEYSVVRHSKVNEIPHSVRNDGGIAVEGRMERWKKAGAAALFSISPFCKHTRINRHFDEGEISLTVAIPYQVVQYEYH